MPNLLARSEQRLRWRAHLALAATVAIAVAAVVVTLSAGARSEEAFRRLRSVTHASDITVFGSADEAALNDLVGALGRSEGVVAASGEAQVFVRPAGEEDLFPDFNLYTRAPINARNGSRVNVPVIVEGRAVNPRRANEIALSEELAASLGISVGDKLTLESLTDGWVDSAFSGGDPGPADGPRIRTTVVGLARSPADFGRWRGVMHLSPAFVERYDGQMRMYVAAEARLEPGAAADPRRLPLLRDQSEVDLSIFADNAATDDGLATIATALRLVAAIAAAAGAVVAGLALARLTRLTLRDRPTLVALGCTSWQLVTTALSVLMPWLALGVVVGAGLGVMFAPQGLIGLAAAVDPNPSSVEFDPWVVLPVTSAALIAGAMLVASVARHAQAAAKLRTRLPLRVFRIDRPLPLVLGARHTLAGEAERGGRTSRAVIVIMTLALATAVAALTVSASIGRLLSDPLLTGQGSGSVVDSGESTEAFDQVMPLLRRDRRVAQLAGLHVSFGVESGGRDLSVLIFDRIRGPIGASVAEGRAPSALGEVGLGPATLDAMGKEVGDRIRLRGDEGSAQYRIVGSVLFPEGDFSYDDGVAMTADGAVPIVGDVHDTAALHQVLFQWADGVDVEAANRGLQRKGFSVFTNVDSLQPPRVTNLGEVEALPRALAAFLGILALATLAHALMVSSRRRAFEAATLRALGFTQWSGSGVVGAQALAIVGIAVVVGVPLGVVLGARVWTLLAERANVVVRTIAPATTVAGFVLAILVASALVAAVPAWRAARLRVGSELRAE